MASARSTLLCFEKQRLIRNFEHAVSEYNRMNSAQVLAVRNGEDFPFQDEIAQAAAAKDNAKYAILAHQQEHGC
jgi:hypothetical protein